MSDEVDEPIHIVSYDPAWPRLFEEEANRLRESLSVPIVSIEHFGTTSVPGMVGKPVVDLLVGVSDMEEAYRVAAEVAELGYENLGEVLWPGRVYLRRRGDRNYNTVVVVRDGDLWNYFTTVRDYLRSHPGEVEEYSKAKLQAIESGATRFLDYSHLKGPFLKGMAERAVRWRLGG